MIDRLLSFVAPHHCYGCDKTGTLLCLNCEYDIISEPFETCISCDQQLAGPTGVCQGCTVAYDRAWCVGRRQDTLQYLIGNYKFTNAKAAHRTLATLLHKRLPQLPENTVIVPVPTVSAHIRQRGYDHMLLMAKSLSGIRGVPVDTILERKTSTKQRDASRSMRIKQAKAAFVCRRPLNAARTYLLIDDVVTTGATANYAAAALKAAGAETVWLGAISRQPLD